MQGITFMHNAQYSAIATREDMRFPAC